jgi:site-specific recombinase XerD
MERYFRDRETLSRLRGGILGPYVDELANMLSERGYTRHTVRAQFGWIGGFSRWLESNGIALREMSRKHLAQYLLQRAKQRQSGEEAALERVLQLLEQKGVIRKGDGDVLIENSQVEEIVKNYCVYLKKERRLSQSTIRYYGDFCRRFLSQLVVDKKLIITSIQAAEVIKFVQQQRAVSSNVHAKQLTSALRSFLRYASFQGLTNSNLESAVPAVANWALPNIPRAMPLDNVQRILRACDQRTLLGKRDFAILLLLVRLGLRAGEVVSLRLDDIDWDTGCVHVRGKGGHHAQLPLPTDVGKAIAAYLKQRPKNESRALFLTVKAPVGSLGDQATVGAVVRRALKHAGVDSQYKGAHQLRHALATRLLREGASLAEIGDLLRHQHIQTTTVYAKVDVSSLRSLALTWPGGAQ